MKLIVGNRREIKRIAEAYVKAKDDLPGILEHERIQLQKMVSVMFGNISKSFVHFDFVKKDPYKYDSVEPIRQDLNYTGIIKVNTSGNNSDLWGPVYNLMFRAVHDFIHAYYGVDFNYKDEISAYNYQVNWTISENKPQEYAPIMELYKKVLRSEIIYQAAYKTHFDEFHLPVQKIILADL